jgi:hypothetical protein
MPLGLVAATCRWEPQRQLSFYISNMASKRKFYQNMTQQLPTKTYDDYAAVHVYSGHDLHPMCSEILLGNFFLAVVVQIVPYLTMVYQQKGI